MVLTLFDKNFQNPSVQQTDLTIEREIAKNTVVSMSYIGSFGRSLPDFVDVNTGPAVTDITYTVSGNGPVPAGTYTTPFYGTTSTVVKDSGGNVVSTSSAGRPNPTYGSLTDFFSGVSSNYHALAQQLNRRMTNHLQFMTSYTWAHALDYGQNASTFADTNDLLNPADIKSEYGNSIFDVRNRFVASVVAQTPYKAHGVLGYLLNDWQIAPIYASQSGLPYSLVTSGTPPSFSVTSTDASGNTTTTTYKPYGSGINGSNGRKEIDVVGRNTFHMKRTINMDLRIAKQVKIRENMGVELIGEAYNIFNHQNVTGVNNTGYIIGNTTSGGVVTPTLNYNSSFGTVTNSNSNFAFSSRQIQIGFRFLF
jgi:hypothetical protein